MLAQTFCRACEAPRDLSERLSIVVEEWVANVVEHGEAAPGSRIAVGLVLREDMVLIVFSDPGRPFDPREAAFGGPDLERGGGAGLELIRAWSRIVAYQRRGGRNRVILEMPLT